MAFDCGFHSVEFLVCIGSYTHYAAVHVGSPSGISVAVCHFCAARRKSASTWRAISHLRDSIDGALRGGDQNFVVGKHLHRREVGRCLHQSFEVAAHRNHAVRCAVKRFDKVAACARSQLRIRGVRLGGKLEFHAWVRVLRIHLDISCEFVEGHADGLFARGVYAEHGMCGAGNGVAEVASVDFGRAILHVPGSD